MCNLYELDLDKSEALHKTSLSTPPFFFSLSL